METKPLQIHVISPWIHRTKAREIYANYLNRIGEHEKKPMPHLLRSIDGTENSHIYTTFEATREWTQILLDTLQEYSKKIPWVDGNFHEPNADPDYLKTKMCVIAGMAIIVLGCLDLEINCD